MTRSLKLGALAMLLGACMPAHDFCTAVEESSEDLGARTDLGTPSKIEPALGPWASHWAPVLSRRAAEISNDEVRREAQEVAVALSEVAEDPTRSRFKRYSHLRGAFHQERCDPTLGDEPGP